jgi:hypothetical protein
MGRNIGYLSHLRLFGELLIIYIRTHVDTHSIVRTLQVHTSMQFLTEYCTKTLPTHFSTAELSAFVDHFIERLPEGRWHPAVLAEIVNSAISPLLVSATSRGTLDDILPTQRLDSMLEGLTSIPDANMAYHLMSQVCLRMLSVWQVDRLTLHSSRLNTYLVRHIWSNV